MSAGTLKLTSNSAAVVGTSTLFTTDLSAGDFIVVTVGGVLYTLPVDAVTSNTVITLVSPFTGPTTTDAAWTAVPRKVLNQVTAELVNQSTSAIRALLAEKGNWLNFYTAPGDISIRPGDSAPAVSGPGWQKMAGLVGSAVQWRGNIPATANLNTYGPGAAGSWNKDAASGATIANGYPEEGAQGVLEVLPGGYAGLSQRYTVSRNGNVYTRSPSAAWNGTDGPWGAWQPAGKKPLTDLGLGTADMSIISGMDWQQFDFISGGIYYVSTTSWIGAPSGISYPSGTAVCIEVSATASNGTVAELTLTAVTSVNTAFKKYAVRVANAKGSRTFSVRQIFTNNDVVPVENGGTGAKTAAEARAALGMAYGTTEGTVAQGNDVRLGTVNGKSGGIITGLTRNAGALIVTSNDGYLYQANGSHLSWDPATGVTDVTNGRGLAAGGIRFRIINADASIKCAFSMSQDGNGYAVNGNWVSATSGRDTKDNIQEIENPRDKMRLIKAATWTYKSKAMSGRFGIGVLADELYEAFPQARITVGDVELDDGTVVKDALSVQAGDSGVTVALHHATILSLMDENAAQQVEIEALKSNMEELRKMVEGIIAR